MAERNGIKPGPKVKDLTGKPFGRLTARTYMGASYWLCDCICGKETQVLTTNLNSGSIQSCGCLKTDIMTKHGLSRTKEYRAWKAMIHRCLQPTSKAYSRYGGRGITVCERWLSVENFLFDMGSTPSQKHTLERRDNNGSYEPGNCYWATVTEQNRNRRSNRYITFQGSTYCLAEWAVRFNISRQQLLSKLQKLPSDQVFTDLSLTSGFLSPL